MIQYCQPFFSIKLIQYCQPFFLSIKLIQFTQPLVSCLVYVWRHKYTSLGKILLWPYQGFPFFCDGSNTLPYFSAFVSTFISHWKKKWSHFDLKSWVTGGTKIRPGILSNWRILKLLGIPGLILLPPVTQIFRSKWLIFSFSASSLWEDIETKIKAKLYWVISVIWMKVLIILCAFQEKYLFLQCHLKFLPESVETISKSFE